MKKITILLSLLTLFACKEEAKKEMPQTDSQAVHKEAPVASQAAPKIALDSAKLNELYAIYTTITGAMAADDFATVQKETAGLTALAIPEFEAIFSNLNDKSDLGSYRKTFDLFSKEVLPVFAQSKVKLSLPFNVFHCPMTGGPGKWAQTNDTLANPYHGAKMLRCGSKVEI